MVSAITSLLATARSTPPSRARRSGAACAGCVWAQLGGYLRQNVGSILDVGCGLGLMHPGLRRAFPGTDIHAFDASEYLCEKFGWQCSSIEGYDVGQSYDLVVCHDVLQYLDRSQALRALSNIEELARVALFFSVLTREDWEQNCDQILTDGNT